MPHIFISTGNRIGTPSYWDGLLREQRLIFFATPKSEASPTEGADEGKKKQSHIEEQKARKEEPTSEITNVQRQQVINEYLREQEKSRPDVRLRVFRSTRDKIRQGLGKIFLAGALVIPPLGAAAYAIDKVSKATVAKVPVVKYIDEIPRSSISWVTGKTSNAVANVVATPALAIDAARPVVSTGKSILHKIFVDYPADFKRGIQKKYMLDKDTDFPAMVALGTKATLINTVKFPFKLIEVITKAAANHPLRATIAALAIIGASSYVSASGVGLIAASKDLFGVLMSILKGLAGKYGTAAPALGIP